MSFQNFSSINNEYNDFKTLIVFELEFWFSLVFVVAF